MSDDLIVDAIVNKIINDENIEYNPVYFYSTAGTGDEFLDEVGAAYQKKYPDRSVIRTSPEAYTNEFILAIRNHSRDLFRKKYLNCDMLIISEIEAFADKETIQEFLYVIMDKMLESHKRIIIGASSAPGKLTGFSDRNLAIFSGGLVLNVSKSDIPRQT